MIRRPPRSTHCISSAASDVYKRQPHSLGYLSISKVIRPYRYSHQFTFPILFVVFPLSVVLIAVLEVIHAYLTPNSYLCHFSGHSYTLQCTSLRSQSNKSLRSPFSLPFPSFFPFLYSPSYLLPPLK
eukprot:TRINITY_DN1352_c0_g1_i3.p1 TRINITY_DN1352_c0_g1~~TRINITY_DN1352_c0_g1_i3.p1  ORF type:complete len:134 (-),score=4.48 TRINITY_DN1352_c0_g1_i3:291-671(-)